MKLNEIVFEGQPPIDAYGPGFFRVMEKLHEGAIFLSSRGIEAWDGPEDTALLTAYSQDYDVLFLGTGADIAPVPAALRTLLEEAGIAFEHMSSPAACRTYNILLSEGRRVAIAALPV